MFFDAGINKINIKRLGYQKHSFCIKDKITRIA